MPSPSEGAEGLRIARRAIEIGLARTGRVEDAAAPFRSESLPPVFEERRGVFVTLTESLGGTLRGCIGFPLPVFRLREAIPRAAWSAAVDDPRFPPVELPELPHLAIELSILTFPEVVPQGPDLVHGIVVGRHGLIVERDGFDGLLLPQVPVEHGWDATRFLSETCRKAGLPMDTWKRPGTIVRRFEAEIFREP
ncbi:MAG: TIGR00296 family protein [Thermoplasmata archaeon]|nr:TIGR00296 family protein [Thermoplasmata archaeon]